MVLQTEKQTKYDVIVLCGAEIVGFDLDERVYVCPIEPSATKIFTTIRHFKSRGVRANVIMITPTVQQALNESLWNRLKEIADEIYYVKRMGYR